MNDKSNPHRSRRASSARGEASQLNAAKARGQREIPQTGQDRRERLLGGRGNRRVYPQAARGPIIAAFVVPIQNPETGREQQRVYMFEVEKPSDLVAAQASVENHHGVREEDGR